jgi:hypothetical protein
LIDGLKLHRLVCCEAVVTEGRFQAAACRAARPTSSCTTSTRPIRDWNMWICSGWGHMPRYLVEPGLRQRKPFADRRQTFEGGQVDLVAVRRRDAPHGPVANRLW